MLRLLDKRLLALAGVAGLLLWGPAANAQTISLGYQENNTLPLSLTTTPTPLASGAVSSIPVAGSSSAGNFTTIYANALAQVGPTGFLDSYTINTVSSAGGYLDVYVTLTSVSGSASAIFTPTMTVNQSSGSYTITALGFYDGSNLAYGRAHSLGTSGANTTQNDAATAAFIPPTTSLNTTSLFSVTEVYQIVMASGGTTNSTIDISWVESPTQIPGTPLPAALPLFGSVLGGGLLFGRLRNRRKAKAQLAAV
jgi:hypothetical protein